MNPKESKNDVHRMVSSSIHILISFVVLAIASLSMSGGRALAEKAESSSNLSDYLMSASGFAQMSLEDQIRYSIFFAQLGYSLEVIQSAPQDQLVRVPNQKKRESAYRQSNDLQRESWWFASFFGEKVSAGQPASPIDSACKARKEEIGKPCWIGGHLSVFYEETRNQVTSEKCRVPVEGTKCGGRQFSCSSFGLSDLFQVVDKYNKENRSSLICVPVEPLNELAVRCGQAFTAWRKNHFKKLSSKGNRVETLTGELTERQIADFHENYSRLLAEFEKTIACAHDKVERCQALNEMRRGDFGNGVKWEYDAGTNTSTATIPGAKGYASFSGRPKGGAFSGQQVDPDFQRSECANVLAAVADIKNAWKEVPDEIKIAVKQFRQNSGGGSPVKGGNPVQRAGRTAI